jgi:demethoxyubiquinone hydroxylase (CLK1/Coq7/Cat5 family)
LAAQKAGAAELPEEVKEIMSAVAKVMTTTSYQI